MAISALKKITTRDVIKGKPKMQEIILKVPTQDGTGVEDRKVMVAVGGDLMMVYGRAFNHRAGTSDLGDYMEYVGTFEARRVADGEIFQSTRVIFPPIAADIALQSYMQAKRQYGDDTAVDFAFVVGVEPDPTGITGYKYTCKPIKTGSSDSDPLAELRSSLALQFVETLGADVVKALGLPMPGEGALQIEHDPKTGEVIEGEKTKGKGAKETA